MGLDARHNIYDNGNTKVDITGGVSKQIGGPNGNGNTEGRVGVAIDF